MNKVEVESFRSVNKEKESPICYTEGRPGVDLIGVVVVLKSITNPNTIQDSIKSLRIDIQ